MIKSVEILTAKVRVHGDPEQVESSVLEEHHCFASKLEYRMAHGKAHTSTKAQQSPLIQ